MGVNPEKRQTDRQAERHGEGGDVGGGWEGKKEKIHLVKNRNGKNLKTGSYLTRHRVCAAEFE